MSIATDLGKVSLTPRGAYSAAASYQRLDVVAYNGSAYMALRDITGIAPADGTDWMLLAQKGNPGDKGDTGDPGRGIASITGNEDGSWVIHYDDDTTETIRNTAYIAAIDAIYASILDGTPETYQRIMRQWFQASGCAAMEDVSSLCDRWYTITRRGWTGGTLFANPDESSLSTGSRTGDNIGMSCTPSTNTVAGTDDYAGNPLFAPVDCNVYLDDTGKPHITAIDGVCGAFVRDDPTKIVGVLQMAPWCKYTEHEDGSYEYSVTDVIGANGYYPWPDAVDLADNTPRAWVVHAKYVFGDGYTCCSNQPVRVFDVSHNSQLTGVRTAWGTRYCGKTTSDDAWVKWMTYIKYASLTLDGIMNGCLFYYNAALHPAVAETGVERVLVTAAQGAALLVGSTVCLGSTAYGKKTTQCSVVDRKKITRIETVTLDETTYAAVYIDNGGVTFDTDPAQYLTTMQWWTGSTDQVLGNDGSPYSNTSTKEPYKIQGIEQVVGVYEILGDVILSYAEDADGVWRQWPAVCRDAAKITASITADYTMAGYAPPCPEAASWDYIKKLGHDSRLPECMFPHIVGGSSATYTCDGYYANAAATTGSRESLTLGAISSGLAHGGLSFMHGGDRLSGVYWNSGGRLSLTGNRGEWAA